MDVWTIGRRIQLARKEKGLAKAELAQMVDLTQKYLSNVEYGKNPQTWGFRANRIIDFNMLVECFYLVGYNKFI